MRTCAQALICLVCVCTYFSHPDKISDESNLRKEGFVWTCLDCHCGKVQLQECPVRKEREMNAIAQLLPQDQVLRAAAHEMLLPTVKVGSPPSVNLI